MFCTPGSRAGRHRLSGTSFIREAAEWITGTWWSTTKYPVGPGLLQGMAIRWKKNGQTNSWATLVTGNVWKVCTSTADDASAAVTVQLTLDSSGNLTATANVSGYSDERVKTNWRGLGDGFVEDLAQVKSGVYDRTDIEGGATQVGVGAQSLRPVMPNAVIEDANGVLSVAYGNAALAAAVELAKEIVALKQQINDLRATR